MTPLSKECPVSRPRVRQLTPLCRVVEDVAIGRSHVPSDTCKDRVHNVDRKIPKKRPTSLRSSL
jgi:hypothetical protein